MNRTIVTKRFILTPSNLWFLGAFQKYLFFILVLTIISEKHHVVNSCHGNHTKDVLQTFETLKGISNTLQNLRFVQPNVDETVGEGSR